MKPDVKTIENIPNPGSDEAIKLGCKCPVLDNHRRALFGWADVLDQRRLLDPWKERPGEVVSKSIPEELREAGSS